MELRSFVYYFCQVAEKGFFREIKTPDVVVANWIKWTSLHSNLNITVYFTTSFWGDFLKLFLVEIFFLAKLQCMKRVEQKTYTRKNN